VETVATHGIRTFALTGGGSVVGWGGTSSKQRAVPTVALSDVLAISAGHRHVLALKKIARPSIRITGPKTRGKFPSSKKILIKGSATDAVRLTRWQYTLNSRNWKNGGALSGTSRSWNKRVGRAKVGLNRVQVRAFNHAGLVSNTAKRNVRLRKR